MREIESYLCFPETLEAYAAAGAERASAGPLFTASEEQRRVRAMRESIQEIEDALAKLGRGSPWRGDVKVSDEFLDPLFRSYFEKLGLPNLMAKKNFYELVRYVPDGKIGAEIRQTLDAIAAVAQAARRPAEEPP